MSPTVVISKRGVQYVLLDVLAQTSYGGGANFVGICVNVETKELGTIRLDDLKMEDPLSLVRKDA